MIFKPGSTYYNEFCTTNPTTGAAQNADSLPAATVTKNGSDDGAFTLTVTNLDTGRYKVFGTVPAGYAAGDRFQVSIAATVAGTAGKAIIGNALIDTSFGSDNYARLGAPVGASIAADIATVNTTAAGIKSKTDNLPTNPAAVGSNMGSVTSVTGSVGSVNSGVTVADKTGFSLSAAYDAAKNAASQTSVNAITTNTARGRSVVPDQVFRPANGTASYEFDLLLYTLQGLMETPDSAPTVHARNGAGASLDASLSSTSMTNIGSGRYKVTFNVAAGDPIQEVLLDFSWSVGGVTFIISDYVFVVDVYSVDFTAADRAVLNSIPASISASQEAVLSAMPAAPYNEGISSCLTTLQALALALQSLATDADMQMVLTRVPAAASLDRDMQTLLSRITSAVPELASIVGGVLDASADSHNLAGSIGGKINADSAPMVIPVVTGGPTSISLTSQTKITLKRGDTYRLTFSLGRDCTGWDAWFGGKTSSAQTSYAMALRQATFTDEAIGTGYVDLSQEDTGSIGTVFAELELRKEWERNTPQSYTFTITDDIVK